MYIAEPSDRKKNSDYTPDDVRAERSEHLDRERREFIRTAAIAVASAVDSNGDRAFSPAECWDRASALWRLKPEDC